MGEPDIPLDVALAALDAIKRGEVPALAATKAKPTPLKARREAARAWASQYASSYEGFKTGRVGPSRRIPPGRTGDKIPRDFYLYLAGIAAVVGWKGETSPLSPEVSFAIGTLGIAGIVAWLFANAKPGPRPLPLPSPPTS